jgi:magnesium-transporting ATPase (P-type)
MAQPIQALPVADVFEVLATSHEGLTSSEAQARLSRFGRNSLPEAKGPPLMVRLAAHFTHMMAWLLWIGGALAVIAQLPQLAIAIWAVNVINGAFSFWQEYKAEKATEALRRLLPHVVVAVRDGAEQRILADELVPGDVLLLSEGDRISADARLVAENGLRIDQSTLTGESHPVRKTSDAVLRTDLARAEMSNLAFAGTSVAVGSGRAVVFATAADTEFGKIAGLTQSLADELSPLQREMAHTTRIVTAIAILVGLVFFLASVVFASVSWYMGFIFAMGMIVAFVPEGLLPTVTLALAMGTQRMAGRNALIKRLSAVETLGCATVICSDKTGTLTQNEMTVRDAWTIDGHCTFTGVGYAPDGRVQCDGQPVRIMPEGLVQLLLAGCLCNNARLLPPNGNNHAAWSILGDPTEAALLVAARKAGLSPESLARAWPRLREIPFDSRRKRMCTVHGTTSAAADGSLASATAFVKGAPKEVLSLCTRIRANSVERALDDADRARVIAANDVFARNGLRVLAIAVRQLQDRPRESARWDPDEIESELTFVGLVTMMDPPRPEVQAAVATCRRAGIRIVMITGDYGLTAESIARRIGIAGADRARTITGVELDQMSDDALRQALCGDVLFARVAPEHKLRVVSALQALGHVVAVTGDGVNDAPALKKADIGVAMGVAGTDVAKEAADVILTDDNFASIVHAIEEGRAVYANIRKFVTYIFTSNMPEAVPFILFVLSGGRIPLALNVMQILSIDLGTDLVPALALGAEPPEPGLMDRPPRDLHSHVITRSMLIRAYLFLGVIQSVAAMSAFYLQYWIHGYWGQWLDLPSAGWLYESATAMALGAVVTTQIGNLFAQRTEHLSALKMNWFSNRLIWIGIVTELAVVAAIIYLPPLNQVFGTAPFALANWLFLLAWTPSLLLADEVRKAWMRRRHHADYHHRMRPDRLGLGGDPGA